MTNLTQQEGMVARWISRLQPFNFAIVHHPGKHHSHANGLSRFTFRPCKRDTCPECQPLRKTAMVKAEAASCFTPAFPYQRHFNGYVEMSEEDAALFWEVETDPNLTSRRDCTYPAPYSVEATLAEGLCPRTTGLPAPMTARSSQAIDCRLVQSAPIETAQDTKPAMQPHATSTWTLLRPREQTLLSRGLTSLRLALRQKMRVNHANQRQLKQTR